MKQKIASIPVEIILTQASDELAQIDKWLIYSEHDNCLSLAYAHRIACEALVKLVEVHDCGSIGGFGKEQPERQSLRERLQWLSNKYAPHMKKMSGYMQGGKK